MKTYFKSLLCLVLVGVFGTHFQTAQAYNFGAECPLKAPNESDFKEILKAINANVIPEDCAAKRKELSDIHTQLSQSAMQFALNNQLFNVQKATSQSTAALSSIYNPLAGLGQMSKDQKETLSNQTIGTIFALKAILGEVDFQTSACGMALKNKGDYINYTANLLNTVIPYVILLSPQATGAIAGISVVTQLIKIFSQKKFDMSLMDQREKFIKNACIYYDIDKRAKGISLMRQGQKDFVLKQTQKIELELNELKAREPSRPQELVEFLNFQDKQNKHAKTFQNIQKQYQMYQSDTLVTCQVIKSFAQSVSNEKSDIGDLLKDTQFLLNDPKSKNPVMLANNASVNIFIEQSLQKHFEKSTPQECADHAHQWYQRFEKLFALYSSQMAKRNHREYLSDLQESSMEYRQWLTWEDQFINQKYRLQKAYAEIESWGKFNQVGSEIEISEIHEMKRALRFAVFGSNYEENPAATWLEYKLAESDKNLNDFNSIWPKAKNIIQNLHDEWRLPSDNECMKIKETLDFYDIANDHFNATEKLCTIFDNTIQPEIHSRTAKYCVQNNWYGLGSGESLLNKQKQKLDKFAGRPDSIRQIVYGFCLKPL